MREYDLIADWYASERVDETGVPEVTALAASIPNSSCVLDIGCGNGVPLTGALLRAGHRVIGLDSSANMLMRFRVNYPTTPAIRGIVQACPFADQTFDAAVAWGVMFHLPQRQQIKAVESISRVLKPNAPFLFSSGDVGGLDPCVGTMNEVVFHYYSFTRDGYRRLLSDCGFRLLNFYTDRGQNGYYLASRSSASAPPGP
jgi:SAM-dependent methyltransferase